MSHPLVMHRLDRLLVDVIERLVIEFPELPAAIEVAPAEPVASR